LLRGFTVARNERLTGLYPESPETGLVLAPSIRQASFGYALETIAELRSTQFLAEESAAFTQAVTEGQNLRPKTQDDVLKLADSALGILEAELKAGKSETLVKFLTAMSHFHSYSFSNMMLIAMQFPEATQVAGFQAWKQLGRYVQKGEQGIRILAPIIVKRKPEEDRVEMTSQSSDEAESPKVLVGFRVVSVFDVSQTDGEPLPDIGKIKGDPGENLAKMGKLIRSKGIELGYEKLYGPEGVSKGGTILIEPDLGPAKTFAVLAHELAHELLHKGELRASTSKNQRELEAEAVSFVVCHAVGIESIHHTADYIQLYQGDVEALGKSLDAIRATAAEIVRKIKT
jgi:antirestriction protein ArdC